MQGLSDCWGTTTLQDRNPPPFQIPLQAVVAKCWGRGFKKWTIDESKLNLSNCKITVHFLSPVPYKLISRYFRGVLDDVGCMFIVVPYICEVLENFWWLRGVNILKLKKFCLIHRTFDSFKSVCIITQLLLLNRSRRVYTKVTLVSSSPGIAPSHVNGTSKASWSTHQNLTDDSAIKPIYIYMHVQRSH